MGLQEGLLKKGSESYAVGDIKTIKEYFLGALAFSIPFTGSVAIVIWIFLKYFFSANYEIVDILGVTALMVLATILFNLIDAFLRAQQKFLLFAVALTLKNSIAISLGYLWASEYGVKGLIIAEIIGLLVPFFFLLYILINIKDIKLYKENHVGSLISNGYKLMLTLVLRNISQFIDRWFIALSLGAILLGYYSFSMILLTISMVLIGFLATVKGPEWIAGFHNHKDIRILIQDVNKMVLKVLACLILVAPFLFLNIENMLITFNPNYAETIVIELIGIVYLAVLAVVPIYLYDWVFVAISKEGYLVKTNLLATVVSVILYLFLWFTKSDIVDFALAFLIIKILILFIYLKQIKSFYVF
jgi:O-antigen/teichoic acid export membrane protein